MRSVVFSCYALLPVFWMKPSLLLLLLSCCLGYKYCKDTAEHYRAQKESLWTFKWS